MSHNIQAAIRWKGMLLFSLPVPARHHDLIRKIHELTGDEVGPANGYEQGFAVDGEWRTREEVFALTGKGRGGKAFSEDLWDSAEACVHPDITDSGKCLHCGQATADQPNAAACHRGKPEAEWSEYCPDCIKCAADNGESVK